MQKSRLKLLTTLVAVLVAASTAKANLINYTIQDIGSFTGYSTPDIGQTYSGTGFVGLYDTVAAGGPTFAHLFGLENVNYSRTALQVGIGSLAGAVINSAYLQFTLLHGSGGNQTVTATSFTADGNLGHFWNAPDNLGNSSYTVNGLSGNSLDVTSLLQSRATANAAWFGLHLAGSSEYQWTYTGTGTDSDAALVRLVVDYTPNAVPEPSTYLAGALLALVFGVQGFRSLRSRKQTA